MAERKPKVLVEQGTNFKIYDDGTILLQNVRFSYAHIDKPWAKDPEKEPLKYSVVGLMPKNTHKAAKNAVKAIMDRMLAEKKMPAMASKDKFMRDGNDSAKVESHGCFTISCSESKKPIRRGPDAKTVDQADCAEVFQSGYWGDILIEPWFQDNKHGKRINASLRAIQMKKKDEIFGSGGISEEDADEIFEAADEEDEDGGFDGSDDDDEL